MIGHTQPRRLAARTVAARIAEELHTELGGAVGWKVRFTDHVGETHAGQADDRRHPAGRADRRPDAPPVRHADHRRGPRAQPQHRLHPGLPDPAAAPPARPQGDHHLGDHRPGAVRRALREGHRRRGADRRGVRAQLPGRGALPADRRPGRPGGRSRPRPARRHRRRRARAAARGRRRHPGVPARRAGDPGHRRRAGQAATCATPRSLPLFSRLSTAEQHRVFAAAPRPPGRAGHQRRRDLADRARDPLRRRPRHGPDLPLLAPAQGAAAADREDLAGQREPAGRALRPGRRRHLHPALQPRTTSTPARSSPSRRSCAPTWPRSSCR